MPNRSGEPGRCAFTKRPDRSVCGDEESAPAHQDPCTEACYLTVNCGHHRFAPASSRQTAATVAEDIYIGEIHVDGIADSALQVWVTPDRRVELIFGCDDWTLNEQEAKALGALIKAALHRASLLAVSAPATKPCDIPLSEPSALHSELSEAGELDEHIRRRHTEYGAENGAEGR